ncbi:MAG: hypothetical protein K2X86_03940 [Cytophagaceae bacterium]|nr:hypothetical protein [Cytophagaceae bacterium]
MQIRKYLLIILCFISFSFSTDKECRNFDYGVSPENVKANETAAFVKEEVLLHNLKALTFAEYKPEANYLCTYIFHCNKLNGVKIKKMSTTGDNSLLNAMSNYSEALAKYNANCEFKIKEKIADKGLKSFHTTSHNSKIYVMIVEENHDFFLVESIFKK